MCIRDSFFARHEQGVIIQPRRVIPAERVQSQAFCRRRLLEEFLGSPTKNRQAERDHRTVTNLILGKS